MSGRALPILAATVMPALLLAGVAIAFTRAETTDEPPSRAAEMDAQLQRHPPSVVVIGNSKAGSDIDGAALAEALDQPEPAAQLVVYGSGAPAWYALLEQRIYGGGYSPRLVVIYGQLASMLHGAEIADSERRAIEAVVTGPSEVLDRRVLRRDAAGRARDRATDLREGLLSGARDAGFGLFFPTMSAADGRAALDELFTTAAQRTTSETRVVPVAEARPEAMQASAEDPAAGFLPEIVRLAYAHGARVVFVRAPVGGTARAKDEVPPEVEGRLYALVNAMGASWIDLHELQLPPGAFRDDLHMTRVGAAPLTAALADRLAAGDVLDGGVIPAAPPLRATAVTREGTLPSVSLGAPVAVEGANCRWDIPISGLDALSDDRLYAAGLGHSSPVRLSVDGVALAPHAPRSAPDAPCSSSFVHGPGGLRVSPPSPVMGTLIAELDPAGSLDAGRGEAVSWAYPGTTLRWSMPAVPGGKATIEAVLRPVEGDGAELSVAGQVVPFVREGRVLRARAEVDNASSAWDLAIHARAGAWLAVHQLRVDTPDPHWIVGHDWARTYLLASTPRFEPRVDGLGPIPTGTDEVAERVGVACLPQAGAEPKRKCHGGNAFLPGWLLAGDVATVHYSGARMAAHPLGIDTLTLTAAAFPADGAEAGSLTVEIVRRQGGTPKVVWSGTVDFPSTGAPDRRVLRIDPPLSPLNPHEVTLRVGGAPLVVTEAVLSEGEAPQAP